MANHNCRVTLFKLKTGRSAQPREVSIPEAKGHGVAGIIVVSVQQDLPKAKPSLGRSFFLGIIAIVAAIGIAILLRW